MTRERNEVISKAMNCQLGDDRRRLYVREYPDGSLQYNTKDIQVNVIPAENGDWFVIVSEKEPIQYRFCYYSHYGEAKDAAINFARKTLNSLAKAGTGETEKKL